MHFKHTDTTELIIQVFYTVYDTLGYGFLEKLYQNALAIELRKLRLDVVQETRTAVHYDLLNFGPKPEIKRKTFDNSRKGSMRWLEQSPT